MYVVESQLGNRSLRSPRAFTPAAFASVPSVQPIDRQRAWGIGAWLAGMTVQIGHHPLVILPSPRGYRARLSQPSWSRAIRTSALTPRGGADAPAAQMAVT